VQFWATCTVVKAPLSFVWSVCLSVCPQLSERLPLDEVMWNLTLGTSMKTCRRIPNLYKIVQKYLSVRRRTYVSLWLAPIDSHKSPLFQWNDIRNLRQPVRYKHHMNWRHCYGTRVVTAVGYSAITTAVEAALLNNVCADQPYSCLQHANLKYWPTATQCSQPTGCPRFSGNARSGCSFFPRLLPGS
jgi:hypothetical protein